MYLLKKVLILIVQFEPMWFKGPVCVILFLPAAAPQVGAVITPVYRWKH